DMTTSARALAHKFAYGPFGVRSGLRALMWLQALNVLSVPLLFVVVAVLGAGVEPTTLVMVLVNASLTIPTLAGTLVCVRWIDQARASSVGLGGTVWRALASLGAGTALGVGLIAAILLGLWAAGFAEIELAGASPLSFVVWLGALLAAAALEELLFRGYAFQWL